MANHTYATRSGEVPRGTLVDLFLGTVDRLKSHASFRVFTGPGVELTDVTAGELFGRVKDVVGALRTLGLARGDRAAILAENRLEWALTDYACLLEGVLDVPIHSVLTAEQVGYILGDSGAKVVFAAADQVDKARAACGHCPHRVTVVSFDPVASRPEGVRAWAELLSEGRELMRGVTDEALRASAGRARPEDTATILYTSGTTGNPKGVVLSHNNLFSNVAASALALPLDTTDNMLSFLPVSHIFQRMVDYLLFYRGCTISYPHSRETLAQDLRVVRPTVQCAVPRVYEKVYGSAMSASGVKGKLVRWARRVGFAWARERLAGGTPAAPLRAQHAIADRIVFKKIRAAVGGRIRYFVSGSAPLDAEIQLFFYAAGMPVLEGYGLTETSPVLCVNTPTEMRVGTVGRPLASTEIRLAEDGEILARGPQVMKEYYNLPEATAEVFDAEGWFRTGDIGELDGDGYLRITDRKKDLIKTSGGKYVAPQPIENRLKRNPFVDQVVMIGDRRKFVALLVVPNFVALEEWARGRGIVVGDRAALVAHQAVQKKMEEEALGGLGDLSEVEAPKKLGLLHTPFSIENNTLTLTDKVRRRAVQELHAPLIDRFYDRANEDRTVFAEP
jgi:long-chain acyl-CoA synthetase